MIFFDLDGTLVNSQGRLYRLFCELCPECKWSYEEYWERKRMRISQSEMLRRFFEYDDGRIKLFHRRWLEKVEEPERVCTDVPVCQATDLLRGVSDKFRIFVLTCRQNVILARRQLMDFGWRDYIGNIVAVKDKSKWLLTASVAPDDILVGDTGEDVKAAQRAGIRSVAVAWGVLSPEVLAEYAPDHLAHTMSDLMNYLLKGVGNVV